MASTNTDPSDTTAYTIPYPAIERHGVIGDRRTAALVASDGTVDWLCLPDYDGAAVFGALLHAGKGGHWKFGPAASISGDQRYRPDSMILETRWHLGQSVLVLTDAMPRPETRRSSKTSASRVVV